MSKSEETWWSWSKIGGMYVHLLILFILPALLCGGETWSKSSSPGPLLALQLCLVLMGNLNPIYENKYYFICLCLSISAFNEVNYNTGIHSTAEVREVSSPKSKVQTNIHINQGHIDCKSVSSQFRLGLRFTLRPVDDEYEGGSSDQATHEWA